MKISELPTVIHLTCIQDQYEDKEIATGYTSDLLSDVMANAGESTVLITIQAHKNTVAVASLTDIGAIVVCNDRPIPDDMVETAREQRIALFTSNGNQYQTSGLLYCAVNGYHGAC
jgi:serine kinase of HPr protein (carbohydrate metabolism regulator)